MVLFLKMCFVKGFDFEERRQRGRGAEDVKEHPI